MCLWPLRPLSLVQEYGGGRRRITDRESSYKQRRLQRALSPERGEGGRRYGEVLRDAQLEGEKADALARIAAAQREGADLSGVEAAARPALPAALPDAGGAGPSKPRKRSRWDSGPAEGGGAAAPSQPASQWGGLAAEEAAAKPRRASRWDATPAGAGGGADATPQVRSRWDETPAGAGQMGPGATPRRARSRWDETPVGAGGAAGGGATVVGAGAFGMETPLMSAAAAAGGMTPRTLAGLTGYDRELALRNQPLTDEDLDAMLPSKGFKILQSPAGYVPIMTPARKLMATPAPLAAGFAIQEEDHTQQFDLPREMPGGLPDMKPEDTQYFSKLLDERDEDELGLEEAREKRIMTLLFKVKNGTTMQRKVALRQLTDKAREFGAAPLFNQVLPLLMSPTLEDQERHLLVKVIDRILYKLDDLVRPYVHKILVVIEPLLIDEDYYARVEGREIISNLAKAAGLATMIAAMRPDIDNPDEYVRNTTARAFSVVSSALGIPALLPFLKAVCLSKKSWQARHTGVKIVQQIAILLGCAVLPHLRGLVGIIEHGLTDEQQKVRTITALSLSALAEAAAPYGIESFDTVLKPLWKGIRAHRGKTLAAFLKAVGFIIPLMDSMYANYYTREVMPVLIREFASPDEEMKKIVLRVIKQCVGTEGVDADYVREEVLPEYFKHFWVRRMALDRRNYRQVVETTVEISQKVGCSEIVKRIVEDLKDEAEPYRRMVMEAISEVVRTLGAADIDARLEELLVDGMLFAFQEQEGEDSRVMLEGFGEVIGALGVRAKPYLPQICGVIKWRLNNKAAAVRQQASDLIARVAPVMAECGEEQLMGHLGVVIFENLGEEYPEVLGSHLGALKAIVNVIGMSSMTPPIRDLLPRLTPILRNRHEKVQGACIELVGRIADRGAEHVPAREWMRISFDLLDMLRAHRKSIRAATVSTFGYIAKAIGPQDVLVTLLNNLKVQERQNRVCTTVAIAIVAETCSPFTVLPALMNEYRTPEINVKNGVLKSLSFLFEYVGEVAKDYIYAVTPLLEDALIDRDHVHRQTAASVISHMALGVHGLGCEDALTHFLNYIFPNIYETSPHLINSMLSALESLRVSLGPGPMMGYLIAGLFHPARKVRTTYWRIYNACYVGSAGSMVAFFPELEDQEAPEESEADALMGGLVGQGGNTYRRAELDLFI